jgi:ABC-type transport system involved in Fe-S cluster assembly fused permease/ATPase subunit
VAKLRVTCALALLIVSKIYIVQIPFLFKRCIDSLMLTPSSSLLAPAGWMVAYAFSRVVYTGLQEGRYLLFASVGQRALRCFMREAFEHVQNLDAAWLSSQSTGELSRVFSRGVRGMNALLRLVVFNVVPTLIEALLVVALLGQRYGSALLVASLLSVATFVAHSLIVVEQRVKVLEALNDSDNRIFARFFNAMLNNEAVRAFTNEEHEVKRYDALLGRIETLSVRDTRVIAVLNLGQAFAFSAGLAAVLALCARRVLSGTMTIGDVVAINALLLQLQQPLQSLGFSYQEIRSSLTDLRQLLTLLGRSPQVITEPGATPLVVGNGMIRFENVSFAYPNGAGPALHDVSFEVPARKKTVIIGPSGSGKSTVLKLIMRAYDPLGGRVTIDGQDVREVSLRSLRRQLGLVPQDTILFDESMLYNIIYGNLDTSEERALSIAATVGLDATASKMPQGYRARVGERGLTLSGGERQRVAIARALLRDPPVMLYDEPTSALDAITETEVEQVLHASKANRTSLVVAHKLQVVQDADLILVMVNGSLVESGTHESLLRDPDSTYSLMWAQQRDGGEESLSKRRADADYYRGTPRPWGDAFGVSDLGAAEWCGPDDEECLVDRGIPLQSVESMLESGSRGGARWLW